MDEATASMDLATEEIIHKILDREFANVSRLIIARKLETVMNCHRILILDKGEIIAFDTPNNLESANLVF